MRTTSAWKPIDEFLFDTPIADTESVTALEAATINLNLSSFKIYQKQKNRRVKTTGNFGPFFKGGGNYQNLELEYLAAMFSDKTKEITVGDETVIRRDGFGIGVSLKIKDIQSKVQFNFAAIAANAQMGLLNAEYSIKGYGIDDNSILKLLPLKDLIGNFNYESYKAILDLVENLKNYIVKNLSEIQLAPIEILASVPLDDSENVEDAQKYFYAAKELVNKLSLEQLITKVRGQRKRFMDEKACKYIYKYFGVDNAYSSPTPISQNSAAEWMKGISPGSTMRLQWIPINPDISKDGFFQSLAHLDNSADLKPHSPEEFEFDGGLSFDLFFNKSSKSFSSKLKLASIGSLDNRFDEESIFFDAVFYKDITSNTPIGDLIYGTRYGIGVRFRLNLRDIEFGINISRANIGAIMELGLANIEYEISGIGINDEQLFSLFPGPKDLNNSTFEEIIQTLESINERIADLKDEELLYRPFMIWVKDEEKTDPFYYHKHVNHVFQSLSEKNRLDTAIADGAQKGLSADLITTLYKEEFGIKDSDKRISNSLKNRAIKWLETR